MPFIIKTSTIIHSTEKGVLFGILTKADRIKLDNGDDIDDLDIKYRFWSSKKLCQSDSEGFLLPETWVGDLDWNQKFIYFIPIGHDEEEERAKECSYKDFLVTAEIEDLDIIAVDSSPSKKGGGRQRFRKDTPPPSKRPSYDEIPF